jgi:predicted peptidase
MTGQCKLATSFNASVVLLIFLLISCEKNKELPQDPTVPPAAAVTVILKPVTTPINPVVGGFYVGMPSNYEQTSEKYPLLLYITGAGQFGNGSIDLPLLLKDGPAQLMEEGRFPGSFRVNNQSFSFLVMTPQFNRHPGVGDIWDCIEYARRHYRVDTARIYLSGLSIGGIVACDAAALNPSKIAAIVPMAGVPLDFANTDQCQKFAASNMPMWIFHSADDPQISVSWINAFVTKLNSFQPSLPPKKTIWPNGGHDAWTRAIEPSYKENGINIYEWMLQYKR